MLAIYTPYTRCYATLCCRFDFAFTLFRRHADAIVFAITPCRFRFFRRFRFDYALMLLSLFRFAFISCFTLPLRFFRRIDYYFSYVIYAVIYADTRFLFRHAATMPATPLIADSFSAISHAMPTDAMPCLFSLPIHYATDAYAAAFHVTPCLIHDAAYC